MFDEHRVCDKCNILIYFRSVCIVYCSNVISIMISWFCRIEHSFSILRTLCDPLIFDAVFYILTVNYCKSCVVITDCKAVSESCL